MDLFAQSLVVAGAKRPRLGRAGLALPSAMFALVAISVLLVGLFAIADLSGKAVRNRQRSSHAMHVAEAGLSHALGTMRGPLRMHHFTRILHGSDNLPGTLDNGRITGYGLPAGEEIPDSGKGFTIGGLTGKYYVTLFDDDADPDGNVTVTQKLTDLNGRLLARCKGVTSDGAVAEIEAIVGAIPYPGLGANGNLSISGNPQILGACGSVHANGNLSASGTSTVTERATATGSVTGNFRLPGGSDAPELGGQPPVPIPALNPMDHCASATYRMLASGSAQVIATGAPISAASLGFTKSGSNWKQEGTLAPGSFCFEGNVEFPNDFGAAALPTSISVIASGSVKINGNPYMTAAHPDGIAILAGGDIEFSGNPAAGSQNYGGLIYSGAQCKINGNPSIGGQVLCANGPDPANATALISVPQHEVSGNPVLRFDCSANVFNKRRVLFWYPKVGA